MCLTECKYHSDLWSYNLCSVACTNLECSFYICKTSRTRSRCGLFPDPSYSFVSPPEQYTPPRRAVLLIYYQGLTLPAFDHINGCIRGVLSHLTPLTEHHVCEIHPFCRMYLQIIFSHRCRLFHYTTIPQFIYSFYYWWAFGFQFGNKAAINIFTHASWDRSPNFVTHTHTHARTRAHTPEWHCWSGPPHAWL